MKCLQKLHMYKTVKSTLIVDIDVNTIRVPITLPIVDARDEVMQTIYLG